MNAFYALAVVIGVVGFLFATINLIYPIKRLGIPTRNRATLVLMASLGLVIGGSLLIDSVKQAKQPGREVAEVQSKQELVQDEQSVDETELPQEESVRGDIGNVDGDPDQARAHKTGGGMVPLDPDLAESNGAGVVSDRFVLKWDLDGTNLLLAVETDLPDTAEVIVSVDLRYYEVGSDDAYSRDYFSEKGPIFKWRNSRQISIDDEAWKTDLMTHQSKMAAVSSDLAFEIDHIEDEIGVRAVVHVNQSDSRFGGHGNPNLSGAAVSRSGNWNIIEAEERILLPLAGTSPPKRSKNVAFNGLKKGESYRLVNETPLMAVHPDAASSLNLEQQMNALGKTLFMPAGKVIRVRSVDRGAGLNPWYEVEVVGKERVTGWINSTALMRSGVVLE